MKNNIMVFVCLLGMIPVVKGVELHLFRQATRVHQVRLEPSQEVGRVSEVSLNRMYQLSYTFIVFALVLIYSAFFFDRPASVGDSSSQGYPSLTTTRFHIVALGGICGCLAFLLQLVACLLRI